MAEPSSKSPAIASFLEENFGRTTAITHDRCIPPPVGCGGEATSFRDEKSRREYGISGLCQACQDKIWPPDDDSDKAYPVGFDTDPSSPGYVPPDGFVPDADGRDARFTRTDDGYVDPEDLA